VEPYALALERLEEELSTGEADAFLNAAPGTVPADKRRAVDELRRMVEEFKISLFAPEIKTAFPISAVRLARKIKEIDELI
jgi:ATP-dependent helicase HrpA